MDSGVKELAQRLAGDPVKWRNVMSVAVTLEMQGKKPERALADALEQFKCAGPIRTEVSK